MSPSRIAGAALVAGTLVFFVSVSIPLLSGLGVRVWSAPLPEYLDRIGSNRSAWSWTNRGIVVGVLLTAVGLGGLTALLRQAGEGLLGHSDRHQRHADTERRGLVLHGSQPGLLRG